MEIGTEEEIEKAKRRTWTVTTFLATLKKLSAFEKKIYDDYRCEYNEQILNRRNRGIENVRLHEEQMSKYERYAQEERQLREHGATVYDRDHWNQETREFSQIPMGKLWTMDMGFVEPLKGIRYFLSNK